MHNGIAHRMRGTKYRHAYVKQQQQHYGSDKLSWKSQHKTYAWKKYEESQFIFHSIFVAFGLIDICVQIKLKTGTIYAAS